MMPAAVSTAAPELRELLDYWSAARGDWFSQDPGFDRDFRSRFLALHDRAAQDALTDRQETPLGALGLLILLDQFPRNAFRGTPRMYATDRQAREVARRAILQGDIEWMPAHLRLFALLPLSHSEEIADHEISVDLHRRFIPDGVGRASRHRDIIRRFGRFPHRNAILGRESRPEELRYLADGGFQG